MSSHYINPEKLKILEFNTVIIGAGASGLNCALHLVKEGIPPEEIAIITDKLGGGTSFNTGSDKQTYYKMSIIGDQKDSPLLMAQDMVSGGAMHGDMALVEATNSIREFFHLVELGMPFPHDKYGGFAGYKTDNDPKQRATSIGPLTSQEMSKCLLSAIKKENIKIFDNHYAESLLLNRKKPFKDVIGVQCIDINLLSNTKNIEDLVDAIVIFKSKNVVLATGGPAIIYKHSVYPRSQNGTLGLAISA